MNMKKLTLLLSISAFFACSQHTPKQEANNSNAIDSAVINQQYFGDKISADSAKPVSELKTLIANNKEMTVKLIGKIEAVCQKKGCWMNLKNENGDKLRVTFKDYKFFVPKDCAGKTAFVQGVASTEETSVAELQEFAKDAGKSKEEIAAIKEPKKELVFEASGVIIR